MQNITKYVKYAEYQHYTGMCLWLHACPAGYNKTSKI
jgi:hypothetical protein